MFGECHALSTMNTTFVYFKAEQSTKTNKIILVVQWPMQCRKLFLPEEQNKEQAHKFNY
jgi:hypothetical protein